MKTLTPVTCLWLGIRASKLGNGTKILKSAGAFRLDHGQLNNVNGLDFAMPCSAKTLEAFQPLFEKLAAAGFEGIALQFTDLQWRHNAFLTNQQWQARKVIGG